MKKLLLFASLILTCVCTQAQLTVNSAGNTTAKNLTLAGQTGIDSTGVLTITSTNVQSGSGGIPPTLMVTKTNEEGIYPIVHYKHNNPIFYVNADGSVYSAMYVSFSDSTSKTNIAPLESSLDKLKRLKGVSYNFKRDLENLHAPIMAETAEIEEQIAEERTRKRVGLIAQEVEDVFPEVVRTRFDGEKGIMYSDLVSVLIAAINEMDAKYTAQIETLQEQVNALQALNFAHTGASPQLEQRGGQSNQNLSEAVLYQNTPNPFKLETTIAYRLPSETQSAAICIYNLNGQQLKKYDLDASVMSNSVTVEGSTLTAGMYIYALIVDGQMVVSKRMVLTE